MTLEAEAEAVVVLGPRSVLPPSMGKERKPSFTQRFTKKVNVGHFNLNWDEYNTKTFHKSKT